MPDEATGSPKIDWFQFVVRFVCGAVAGVVASAWLFLRPYSSFSSLSRTTIAVVSMFVVLGFGLLAATIGDEFWFTIFNRD